MKTRCPGVTVLTRQFLNRFKPGFRGRLPVPADS